ncbi:helix-turn-helix domain-containing protein [Chryseobacterium sp. IT-36CA2]|uniref:helix-turn-helix domain-containing protein n=1 Tax=Chryseobacterium sp. IT-36CA2 TaxID=3026460 RepID=UPI0039E16F1C
MVHHVTIKDITSVVDPTWNSNEYFISNGEPSSEIYPDKVRTNFYLLFHIVQGWMDVNINDEYTIRVMPDMILAISPEMIYQDIACSESYIAHAICFTKDFLLNNIASIYTLDTFSFFSYGMNPLIKLKKSQQKNIAQLYDMMKVKRYHMGSYTHLDLIRALFFSYLYETLIIYKENDIEVSTNPLKVSVKQMDVYMRFKKMVSEQASHEKDIKFYADRLSVTPKHLTKLIKSITGQSAKKIINDTLILISGYKLKNTDASVSKISEELSFSDSPSFCKFFKKQTGLTPLEYRNTYSESSI